MVLNDSVVEGAHRIGGLWRIYLTDEDARVSLLATGISLRSQQITLRDRNPFLNIGFEGVDTTRLFVRNIPLSYDNAGIEKALKEKGVEMIVSLKYARARTLAGKLTNLKTGDRFVDIVIPKEPLPKKLSVGIFTASLYHKEQKQSANEIECGNCKQKGNRRRDCKNGPVCYAWLQSGHKKGDKICPAFTKTDYKKDEGSDDDSVSETDSYDIVDTNDVEHDDDKIDNDDEGTAENEYFECSEMGNIESITGSKLAELKTSADTAGTSLQRSKTKPNNSDMPRPSVCIESQSKG